MPLILAHETFFESAIFKIANEVAVASLAALLPLLGPAPPSSRTAHISIPASVRGWRVVRRAWLETDRLAGIQVASDSLYGDRNPTLLHFHR